MGFLSGGPRQAVKCERAFWGKARENAPAYSNLILPVQAVVVRW